VNLMIPTAIIVAPKEALEQSVATAGDDHATNSSEPFILPFTTFLRTLFKRRTCHPNSTLERYFGGVEIT
jgi:hypothetical protein